jgi:N-acyl-D-aspartate/D-glutamate deacylase
MSDAAILASIDGLRAHPAYQAAEALRRGTIGSAAAMARAHPGSDEFRAVVLLVSTWETIALMMSAVKKKGPIFGTLPVCHMYRELRAAIEQLGNAVKTDELDKLYRDYEAWLKSEGLKAEYVSALCGGLHARFG